MSAARVLKMSREFVHHPSKCDKWHLCMRIPSNCRAAGDVALHALGKVPRLSLLSTNASLRRAVRALRSRTPRRASLGSLAPPCPPWRSTRVSSSRAAPRRAPRAFALPLAASPPAADPLGGARLPGSRRGFRSAPVTSMALKTGIVGLPNVGKSTLFNALVENSTAEAANYPFCTIEPNSGIVPVPDDRLATLAGISGTTNIVPTTCEFVDIAGLVRAPPTARGWGTSSSRTSASATPSCTSSGADDDDVIHVDGRWTRCRTSPSSTSSSRWRTWRRSSAGSSASARAAPSPTRRRRRSRASATPSRSSTPRWRKPARLVDLTDDEWALVKDLMLLTAKPCIYAATVRGRPRGRRREQRAREEGEGARGERGAGSPSSPRRWSRSSSNSTRTSAPGFSPTSAPRRAG